MIPGSSLLPAPSRSYGGHERQGNPGVIGGSIVPLARPRRKGGLGGARRLGSRLRNLAKAWFPANPGTQGKCLVSSLLGRPRSNSLGAAPPLVLVGWFLVSWPGWFGQIRERCPQFEQAISTRPSLKARPIALPPSVHSCRGHPTW